MTSAAETISDFHKLYYNAAYKGGTWRNTHWMGIPVAKCPLDMWIYQEILFRVRPDLIIETGTFQGGSANYLADMCDILDKGRVITIDIAQPLVVYSHPRLTYLIGSSTAPTIVQAVQDAAASAETVLIILDSDHSQEHVFAEMQAYAPLVTPGSYLVVEDTNVYGHPVFVEHGPGPAEAVTQYLAGDDSFEVDRQWEKFLLTFNPGGYLRKKTR